MRRVDEFVNDVVNQIRPVVAKFVFGFEYFRKCLQNVWLEKQSDLTDVASDMMHHGKNAVVDEFTVLLEVSEQLAILVHNIDRGEPYDSKYK